MTRIYISVGSNIEPEYHLRQARTALTQALGELELSPVYQSVAVGFDGDPFLNMVIGAHTNLGIEELVTLFKRIELDNGRPHNAKKFSSRTLDLDLLLYGEIQCSQPVTLPRAEICHNAFVLWPLSELAPHTPHPDGFETYANLWQAFDKESQQLWPVAFCWELDEG